MRFLWIRKTGTAVHWLPIRLGERDDGEAIYLPCPATDLIRLAIGSGKGDSAASLHRLLRLNPSLLLFALSNYQQALGTSPNSARDLVAWSQSNLIHEIGSVDFSHVPVPTDAGRKMQKKLDACFEDFLSARSNRKLRRSLRRFLRMVCGFQKSTSKSTVARLVGKKIRAKQFKCKQVRRKETFSRSINQWSSPIAVDIDVASLFELAEASQETTARFAARLEEEKLASMKQLAYGASHEINNPLANIATRAQTMLATEIDPEKRHKLSVIYEQAMRAHEMISDMMLFAHPPALNSQRVSVRLLIARIVHELKPVFDVVPEIELRVLIGDGVDQAQLDPTQFAVAIKNLVQNSIEALRSGDEQDQLIEIRIDQSDSHELRVSVWDNGQGITEDVARHMFDPFYSGREAGRGLGFGLSKVWTIAKLHGGDLRLDTSVDQGTRFVLTLSSNQTNGADFPAATLTIHKNRSSVEEEAA